MLHFEFSSKLGFQGCKDVVLCDAFDTIDEYGPVEDSIRVLDHASNGVSDNGKWRPARRIGTGPVDGGGPSRDVEAGHSFVKPWPRINITASITLANDRQWRTYTCQKMVRHSKQSTQSFPPWLS